jgi:hypothetical protein
MPMHRSRQSYSRVQIAFFCCVFVAIICASLLYERLREHVSSTPATLNATHTKCGPRGPFQPPMGRPKLFRLMARLPDGQLVTVERDASLAMPDCGATITVNQRLTPWGMTWYSTRE